MNIRNNTSRKMAKSHHTSSATVDGCEIIIEGIDAAGDAVLAAKPKNRKKREELSSSATKSIKKEFVDIVITFE
jgi:hypothetical protein